MQIVNDIRQHARVLIETDSMYVVLSFYSDLIHLSLTSLINATIFRMIPMKSYAEKKMKENLCQLNLCLRKQCSLFLTKIRSGYEQNDLIKYAQHIHKSIRNQLSTFFDTDQLFHDHIRQFEQFIFNLIRVGYRYDQFQREPFDDLFINIPNDLIDSNLPNTEVDL